MNDVYSIVDLTAYANAVRENSASSLSSNHQEDLDEFIKISETINIIESHSLGLDDDDNHIIDNDTHSEIVDDVSNWIFNIGLAKLAGSNQLECAWDDDSNEMVFWKRDAIRESQHYDTTTDNRD